MAMVIFTVVSGLGVVFLLYVLVQFWKEGHRTNRPAARDSAIEFERENRPTVVVVTHGISDRLHASLEAPSIKAEPAPVSRSAHAGLPVASWPKQEYALKDKQVHSDLADVAKEMRMNRHSTR
jgi:hypothetical protein